MYKWLGMEKVSYEEVLGNWEQWGDVFLLDNDNSEGLCNDIEMVKAHYENGGEFGIETSAENCAKIIFDALTDNASDEYAEKVFSELKKLFNKTQEKNNC